MTSDNILIKLEKIEILFFKFFMIFAPIMDSRKN